MKIYNQMTGFTATRELGKLRAANGTDVEANQPVSRLSNHISFSSGLSSSSGLMPKIPENISDFATDSWSDPAFSGLKTMANDNDMKMFTGLSSSLEAQVNIRSVMAVHLAFFFL